MDQPQEILPISSSIPVPPSPLPLIPDTKSKKKVKEENEVDQDTLLDALNLSWCFGYNKQIGVLNLCQDRTKKLFQASSHIGIVYDFDKNQQKLLQGHRNNISCCTVSDDKRWLVTADAGEDSTIIIWDLNSFIPVQTYFNTHLEGIISVAITPDSKYIASLSAQYPQVLAIWEWTTDSDKPICTAELNAKFGPQSNIRFNVENINHIITNSHSQTIFYEWNYENGFIYFAPILNDSTFNKPVGRLTQSIFQSKSNLALTATTLGNLVVWKTVDTSGAHILEKKAFKLFKLQEKSINVLTLMNNVIVIGDSDGSVTFIDQHLHILMWYKHLKLGPICSLSFSQINKDSKIDYEMDRVENDATLDNRKFICTDFIISTNSATVGFVTKSGTSIEIVSQFSDKPINALACHPNLPRLCFGNHNGFLQLWDYDKKLMISSRNYPKGFHITCLEFDKKGDHIAIGFKNGQLQLIDSISLEDCLKAPFKYSKDAITHIQFSEDSTFLATAEADFTISIYKHNNKIATELYTFLGRYRSHYKEIVDIIFGKYPDNNQTRLISLGKDRVMVEYDLEKSNYDELVIKDSFKIEQYGIPKAMIWHPPIEKESFILTVNDQWKYKLYNSITKMCRKTLLGPTFGSNLKKMILIPTSGPATQNRYMAYITEDKLGLQKFPLNGNPFDSIALFAHPDGVANFVSSNDGKFLFTAGGENNNIFMWKINTKSLEAQSILGGPDLKPFYGLIDGGREGDFFKEMKELFYYCQLRHHGLHENTERVIKLTIPLSEISFLMRGLGFYPTEQEIEEMINEVKFSKYVESNQFVEEINLDDFIKLYINHRPAFGLDPYEIYNSFKILSKGYTHEDDEEVDLDEDENPYLPRYIFLNELQSKGEHITDYELADCISNLLHTNNQVDEMTHDQMANLIDQHIPENLTVDRFMTDLLGIPSEDFDQIMQTWEKIRTANNPKLQLSKKLLTNREPESGSSANTNQLSGSSDNKLSK